MTGIWPADPRGDMAPILQASVEAAMARHPSGGGASGILLTAADRCDSCGAGAAYRVCHKGGYEQVLDFCVHHWRKNFPSMVDKGWVVVGCNPDVLGSSS